MPSSFLPLLTEAKLMTSFGFLAATGGEVLCFLLGVGGVVLFIVSSLSGGDQPETRRVSSPVYVPPPAPPPAPVPDFMIRGQMTTVGEGEDKMQCIEIQFRGRIPVRYTQELGILTTAEDATDGGSHAVYSTVRQLADPTSRLYRTFRSIGSANVGCFAPHWVTIAVLPIGLILTPYSGPRRLRIHSRCIPSSLGNVPLSDERLKSGVVCSAQTFYSAEFPLTGYLELADKRREGMVATVELALACACADGTVDQRELRVVHRWMTASLSERSDDSPAELAKLKAGFNDAMKSGVRGRADVRALCAKILKLSLPSLNQSALALCVDVIAADGELHADELKTVRAIARDLGLDYDKLQALIDKQFVNSSVSSAQENLEAIVGIDPSWDKERIRKHLAEQFMKWNSRAPAAKSVEDQSRIRSMLDAIARLKKKYA